MMQKAPHCPWSRSVSSQGNLFPWTEGGWVDSLPRFPSGGKGASWCRYWLATPGDGAGEAPSVLQVRAPPRNPLKQCLLCGPLPTKSAWGWGGHSLAGGSKWHFQGTYGLGGSRSLGIRRPTQGLESSCAVNLGQVTPRLQAHGSDVHRLSL